jgi:sugar phosphate isomerase/epimerase
MAVLPCFADRDFYAFDNGTGRDQKLPFAEQAALLARTGYAGMGLYSGTERIPDLLKALDERKLNLLGIYVHSYVDDRPVRFDPGIPGAVRDLAGRKTMIVLTVQGRGPQAEQRAIENIRAVADLAAAQGLRVCLYPHIDFYVETTADALRLVRKAERDNVGVALNLFHTVAFYGEGYDVAPLVREALPRLWLVSINGITRGAGRPAIERLDRSDYDLAAFIKTLARSGYRGPVALQSYRVKGDLEENLRRSIAAWRSMIAASGPI